MENHGNYQRPLSEEICWYTQVVFHIMYVELLYMWMLDSNILPAWRVVQVFSAQSLTFFCLHEEFLFERKADESNKPWILIVGPSQVLVGRLVSFDEIERGEKDDRIICSLKPMAPGSIWSRCQHCPQWVVEAICRWKESTSFQRFKQWRLICRCCLKQILFHPSHPVRI